MSVLDERKALERLSLSYRKLTARPQPPPPPAPAEETMPPRETPALSPPASPETLSAPQG